MSTCSRVRLRALVVVAATLATLAFLATPALGSKQVLDYFGDVETFQGTGAAVPGGVFRPGGVFSNSLDVAANGSGAGPADAGDIYVADTTNNRVQRFDSEGNFLSAWGANVVHRAEVQFLTVGAAAGTFTVTLEGDTTVPIPVDAGSDALDDALDALPAIGADANVSVQGGNGVFRVVFHGALNGVDLAEMTTDDSALTGTAEVETRQDGFGGAGSDYEVCAVAAECDLAVATGGNGTAAGNGALDAPQALAVDEDTGNVYVSDFGNRRVSVYDGVGDFIRSFGWNVVQSGPGNTGAKYEICDDSDGDVCRAGVGAGSPGAGQFHTSSVSGAYGIAVSPPDGEAASGQVLLANSGARRVETFGLDGSAPASFGSAAVFGESQPREIALDSRGIVYASNSEGDGQVERYDSENVNGEGIGFLEPISAGVNEAQTVHFEGFKNGNTFTLTCPGGEATEEIEWSDGFGALTTTDTAAALDAKCGAGGFSVTGTAQDVMITYAGAFAETDVAQLTCATVIGSGSCEVAEEVNGRAGALLPGNPAIATAGLAVDPDSDAGGPEKDILHVLRERSVGEAVVQQFGPAAEPGLAAAPAADEDRHGEDAGLAAKSGSVLGLGIDEESERFLVAATGSVGGLPSGRRVFVLAENVAPEAALDPVASFDARSATFSGSVDPNGFYVDYRFEYVDDAEFGAHGFENAARIPFADAEAGNGESPVAVEHDTPHTLVPGTLYHVRLVAKQAFSSIEAIAGPQTFTTETAAPTIDGAAATVAAEEATLRGAIDPENETVTDWHFEWGTGESYGNTTAAGELEAGAGPVAVSADLAGLTPGQTYHFRLVAENGTGLTHGPDRTFTTLAGEPQLPVRAYEIVTPYPTLGVPFFAVPNALAASEDGDRVAVGSPQPFPDSALPQPPEHIHNGSSAGQYGFVRESGGWRFDDVGLGGDLRGWSSDGTRFLTRVVSDFEDQGRFDPDDRNNDYDVYQRLPDGSLVWISRDPRIPAGAPQTTPGDAKISGFSGEFSMSHDGRAVVFGSGRGLDDADTTRPGVFRLYKWTEGEGAKFIGARPDGSVPLGGSDIAGGGPNPRYTVSRDGSRVIFRANRTDAGEFAGNQTIYVQTDGEPTVEAVKESGVPPLPAGQPFTPVYRGAAADSSRIFFTTSSRLTADSGGRSSDLYAYDVGADEVRDLTPRLDGISDSQVVPAVQDRGRVRGVAANSEDGRRVYFVADARYEVAPNPLGELPSPAGRNLYLAELAGIGAEIELRFVTALGDGDNQVWQTDWAGKAAYASPDGAVLSFGSRESLTGQGTGGTVQQFVYDAGADTLVCVSCPADGSLPAGDVNTISQGADEGFYTVWQEQFDHRRFVAANGTVAFHTRTPLLAADENVVDDVYEYRDGKLRLVSSGKSTQPSRMMNMSRDGSSIFFQTLEALVPRDKEPGVPKLYVARVGGGFPLAAERSPCDLGAGACEGAGTTPSTLPGAGTAVFEGPGNVSESRATRCTRHGRPARRLARRAQRLRRAARRAGNPQRARRLRRRARRSAHAARKRSTAAKRCRRAARRAGTDRRTER